MFNRLKQIGQCSVIIKDTLDCLIRLDVTKMRAQGRKIDTYGEQNAEACVYCLDR